MKNISFLKIFAMIISITMLYIAINLKSENLESSMLVTISITIVGIVISLVTMAFAYILNLEKYKRKIGFTGGLLLFIWITILYSIILNKNQYYSSNKKDDFGKEYYATKIFYTTDSQASFRYPSNWYITEKTLETTQVLLYENSGTDATCNLSVVPQDQSNLENYNSDYFNNNLSKVHKVFNNVENEIKIINGKAISWTTYDFIYPIEGKTIQGTSITLTTLHNGNRFMLIFNVPKQNMNFIVKDIKTISESLTFIKKGNRTR